jgi:hypothetical protein
MGVLVGCSSADAAQPADVGSAATIVEGTVAEGTVDAGSDGGAAPAPSSTAASEATIQIGAPDKPIMPEYCSIPGRFSRVDATRVRDESTGLTWETAMRAPATWAEASSTCSGIGMRLPSYAEWSAVMPVEQVNSAFNAGTGTPTCSPPRDMYVAPFDQVAMPTTVQELGGAGGFASLWTQDADPSESTHYTVDLSWGDGDPWLVTKGYVDIASNAYRCVE